MAGRFAIKAGKSGAKSVPTPSENASFALGTRPTTLRSAPVPRIKPMLSVRDYGKPQANPSPAPFGNTGLTGRS